MILNDLNHLIELRNYLFNFISDNKRDLFETKIHHRTRHLTLVLEDIYQGHNASAVLRSAEIFGIQDVHIIENFNNYNVSNQVAMGSKQWVNINKYRKHENNTLTCISQLKDQGYRIVATSPHAKGYQLSELPIEPKTALLFGTELKGLSKQAMDLADDFVTIPMYGFTESFNISVSAALCMYDFTQRLRASSIHWQLSDYERVVTQIEWAKATIKKVKLIIQQFENQYHEGLQKVL